MEGQTWRPIPARPRRRPAISAARCHEQVHVTRGHTIPKCPNCGNDTFDTRLHEPGRQSS